MSHKKRKKAAVGRTVGSPNQGDHSWTTLRSGGLQILECRSLARFTWLAHGFSTRLGGSSVLEGPPEDRQALNLGFTEWDIPRNVVTNRAKLLAALGTKDMKLVTLEQFHSDVIHVLNRAPDQTLRGDAAITHTPGLLLAVQTADCIPVLLVDPQHRVVAAVHAGWRGTLGRIVAKTLGRMQASFDTRPPHVVAALGPGIGGDCYVVGPEVAQAYASQFREARKWFAGPFDQLATGEEPNPLAWLKRLPPGHHPPPSRVRLDLIAANRWQLLQAGVRAPNIVSSPLCTACRTDLLFSYRKEGGRTGRLMAVVGLRED
ncbi:MAG TPA: peptidoglycan editing factor PgeF [Candidatus Acidoferrales bacterium]|nr:peptidoglycan editing factor PgeF [Candidatus Acidoferrales bacterium]